MSFIGNVPAESYTTVVKDTFSGNDSTTDFTLSIPATTNSVEVFVENVQQEPTDAYTIAGTTLSFTAAPVTGTDNIYVIHRGPAVQQVVPPAGVVIDASTVTASSTISATGNISTEGDLKVEVASGGIYTITGTDTASNRTLTLPDEAGTVLTSASSIPASSVTGLLTGKHFFHAYRSTDQSLANNTNTIAVFDTEFADVSSAYNTSTGEFTVPEDGLYFFVASAFHAGSGNTNLWNGRTAVRQAGSLKLHHEYNYAANYPNEVVQQASGIIDCTTGDVIDVQVRIETSSGSGSKLTGGTPTYFLGVMIA